MRTCLLIGIYTAHFHDTLPSCHKLGCGWATLAGDRTPDAPTCISATTSACADALEPPACSAAFFSVQVTVRCIFVDGFQTCRAATTKSIHLYQTEYGYKRSFLLGGRNLGAAADSHCGRRTGADSRTPPFWNLWTAGCGPQATTFRHRACATISPLAHSSPPLAFLLLSTIRENHGL